MKLRSFVSVLPLLATLLAASPSDARRRSESARQGDAQSGAFDYYLLSLSLAPNFCALSPANASKAECRSLTAEEFHDTPLTIHGLWPNRARVGARGQPQDCDGPAFDVSDGVQSELRRLMPAGPGLERYEWRKHGTCSGLSAESYFATEVKLARYANQVIGAAILTEGSTLLISELLQAVGRTDPALAVAIVVDCRYPSGGGDALVAEIRVALAKDFRPIPAASVGMGQNSGCPGGAGRLPGPERRIN